MLIIELLTYSFLGLSFKQFSEHGNCLFFHRMPSKKRIHQPMREQVWKRIDLDLGSESLVVSIRRGQNANTITMYGLSKTLAIKLSSSF